MDDMSLWLSFSKGNMSNIFPGKGTGGSKKFLYLEIQLTS